MSAAMCWMKSENLGSQLEEAFQKAFPRGQVLVKAQEASIWREKTAEKLVQIVKQFEPVESME